MSLTVWRPTTPINGDSKIHRTVCIGVASLPDHGETCLELLEKSDAALYADRDAGRNCVHLVGCSEPVG